MDQTKLEEQIAGLAALSDPTRRRLYFFVASRLEGAGREEAAEAVGITRALAAFHLDRLVEDELLVAGYRRLTGRSGPGAGRPAKIYRRSTRQLAVSLPQRNYELLARLLAQAMMGGEGASSSAALADAAHELGTNLGIQARRQAGPRAGRDRLLAEAAAVLNDCGFEAAREDACLCLRNCPFSPLSGQFTEVVCAMNLSLMQGVISGLRVKGMEAALAPSPERCCVVFQPASRTSPS
jgi:predicted ArsR family transcriptional regulator